MKDKQWLCVHVCVFPEPSPIMIAGVQTPRFGLYIKYVNVVGCDSQKRQ